MKTAKEARSALMSKQNDKLVRELQQFEQEVESSIKNDRHEVRMYDLSEGTIATVTALGYKISAITINDPRDGSSVLYTITF